MRHTWVVAIGVTLALSGPSIGQQVRGTFNPAGGAQRTNIQLALGKLSAEVQGLAPALGQAPPPARRDLTAAFDRATAQIDAFARAAATQPPARLRDDFAAVSREVKALVSALQPYRPAIPSLRRQTAAVLSAPAQLDYAVTADGGDRRDLVRRLARSVESQARVLRETADGELPANRFGDAARREIAGFERAASSLAWTLALSAGDEQARPKLAAAVQSWAAVGRALRPVPPDAAAQTRTQAAGVDRLFRNLVAILDPAADLGPGFSLLLPHKERPLLVIGAGPGAPPLVRLTQTATGQSTTDFMAYDAGFRGGVRVAVGDVNGDGVADIVTAPGPGMTPLVRVFDGRDLSLVNEFLAYEAAWRGGVFVALGDFNRDGRSEIITGADAGGGPHVRVFGGLTGRLRKEFLAYDREFNGGVRVAAGQVSADGSMSIITAPGKGMAPLVRLFDARTLQPTSEFLAYDEQFLGGVWVSAADFGGSGRDEIVTGADVGGPHVRVFRGRRGRLLKEFLAYDGSFQNGVRVAVQDVNRDGQPDIITVPGPGLAPRVRVFDGSREFAPLGEFLAFPPGFRGGAFIATR